MDKQLRLFAGQVIVSSKLPSDVKRTLLDYVKEESITDGQVKVLLMDGEIVKLDEQAEAVVKDRFDAHMVKQLVSEVEPILITAVAAAAIVAKIAYNAARLTWSKAHRDCMKYRGNDHQKCLAKYKIEAAKKMIEALTANKNKCNKSKNPEKCIKIIDGKIEKAKKKIEKIVP